MSIISIILLVTTALLSASSFALYVALGRLKHSTSQQLADYQKRLAAMENQLSAVLDGAVGMGDKMQSLAQQVRSTRDEQLQISQRDLGNLPFNKAVQLVEQGAGVETLVRDCGLSRSEADLVVMMHGKAKAQV